MALIKQNELLANYCTYKIGGPGKAVFFASNVEEIIAGLETARENNFKFFILGGGSNVLFSDAGFFGLVLKIENDFARIAEESPDSVLLSVGAGTLLGALANFARDNSLSGLEWAVGIPGTLGGAIRGNAGAFHGDIAESVRRVEALEIFPDRIKKKSFARNDCGFSYRDSVFKRNKNLVVVAATLVLQKGDKTQIRQSMDEYLAKKRTSQPLEYPSAGSVFMNPPGFFAGKLIEGCGFKGKIIGGAQVSEKHSNFIINRGNAKAGDVLELIAQIKAAARDKFKVDLKEEIEIVEPQK